MEDEPGLLDSLRRHWRALAIFTLLVAGAAIYSERALFPGRGVEETEKSVPPAVAPPPSAAPDEKPGEKAPAAPSEAKPGEAQPGQTKPGEAKPGEEKPAEAGPPGSAADDAAQAITHVVRGEDHLSNTPRQLLLYEALGLTPPVFAHLSMVLGPDHAPLSKRHGATSVAEFRARGFLPEALVNYLALLGWSPGENEELLSVGEMARRFDLAAVSHSAAVFDTGKLAWMNRHYMKEAAPDRLVRETLPYFERAGMLTATTAAAEFVASLLPMVAGSVDRLDEIPDRVAVIFAWDAERAAALVAADPNVGGVVRALVVFADAIGPIGPLDRDAFRAAAAGVRQQTGLKGRDLCKDFGARRLRFSALVLHKSLNHAIRKFCAPDRKWRYIFPPPNAALLFIRNDRKHCDTLHMILL